MLSESLRPIGFDTWEKEDWSRYQDRLRISTNEAEQQFYRQVVYDHFDHFNSHYPEFQLSDYEFAMIELTAEEAYEQIRFFRGEVMDWWNEQFEEFARVDHSYIIFRTMARSLTFPFPPILVRPERLASTGRNACGEPLHLIEGTHRVSYLRHMLEKGLIAAGSKHQFVLLSPFRGCAP